MNRFLSRLLVGGFFCLFSFQLAGTASALCCKCYAPGDATDICLTGDAASCSDLLKNSKNPKVANFNCPSVIANEANCRTIAEGGTCSKASSVATYSPPASEQAPSTQPSLTVPEPGIEIPGLVFSPTPQVTEGKITIPFIAQYISALYNWLIGAALIVAAVMLVYGGFRYVLGSTAGDIARGKEVVLDSLVGLVLVFGAFTLLRVFSPPAASLKPLDVLVIKRDPMEDYLRENGTTNPDAPQPKPEEVVKQQELSTVQQASSPETSGGTGSAAPASAGMTSAPSSEAPPTPLLPSEVVDLSGLSYDSSLSATENIGKYCTGPSESAKAATFEQKQKLLAKAVLGFHEVCIKNHRCVYTQASVTSIPGGTIGRGAPLSGFAVKKLEGIGISAANIWSGNAECVEAWDGGKGASKVNNMAQCLAPLREQYYERYNKKIQDAKLFASDCVSFVIAAYGCAGVKGKYWGNAINSAIVAVIKGKEPSPSFMQQPQLVAISKIGDPGLEAKIAQKGGLKFGDIFYVSGAVHYYLYTGGRSDVPFTFIEMGGSGPGANVPGIGSIGGMNIKTISWQEDLKNKITTTKEYIWSCPQRGCTSKPREGGCKSSCSEKDMIPKKAAYSPNDVVMIWRPYAE